MTIKDTDDFDNMVANWHRPSRLSQWIMRHLGCTFPETNHEALSLNYKAVVEQRDKARAALHQLETWDMLYLDPETGHGTATADAPWARALIQEALT